MSLVSFFKEAGQKLFGHKDAEVAATQAQAAPNDAALQAAAATANQAAAAAIVTYIGTQNLDTSTLSIEFDGASGSVMVSGVVPDQATKEKILLCCGNVQGVGQVNELITVDAPADESRYHTVERGETLSAIAKTYYGDASKYLAIFEANRPMLSNPDKIYPGQMLRIPA